MVYVEDAVIVEVYETEPHFKVETVRPEVIQTKKKHKKDGRSKGLLESLFGLFFDPFDLFGLDEEEEYDEIEDSEPVFRSNQKKEPIPELALITETNESKTREYRFLYYEITNV